MDPLEWTHQWDDYEMLMYADSDESGIFMQVSRRIRRDGAEEWGVIYNRKIAELMEVENPHEIGTPEWEDVILRHYLHQHPTLVTEEKLYLRRVQESWQ